MTARRRFDTLVLPHLDAGYNVARWLMRDRSKADDALQEAAMRAYRYLDSVREEQARPWFLAIVRNTCFTMLERERGEYDQPAPDEVRGDTAQSADERPSADPSARMQQRHLRDQIDGAIRALPPALREMIVLRELEELPYADIARIAGIPLGTVMSRLARARERLRAELLARQVGN